MIKMQKTILLISILMMAGMASAASTDIPKASQTPGDAFYFLDRFSESIELTVAKAPIIGSPELEAKVRANHAAERLAEAQKLANNNKSEKVDKLMSEYSKQTNLSVRSAKKANNTNLSQRLGNVTKNHVKALQDVQQKVPEQAQKGIQNAIDNSQKNQKDLEMPETARDRGGKGRTDKQPGNLLNGNNNTQRPDKSVNKTADRAAKQFNRSPVENNQSKTSIKQNLSERTDRTTDSVNEQNLEENKTNSTEETVEDTDSKITGKAVGKPSGSELP
jgi:hypothetical protein